MSELKASARLRMMAKGACSRGDVIAADRLARIAIDLDNKDEEIAALKTYASKGDEEIEKLSPLVEIVSNQKQRIQQMEEQLSAAKTEIAEYREALECLIIEYGIHDSYDGGLLPDNEQSATVRVAINLLAKHKESK